MAGVEVVGAILSLAALTTSILEPIQRYHHDSRGLKILQVELSALSEVMNALQPLVESPHSRNIISIPQTLLLSCHETLLETQRIINSMNSKSGLKIYGTLAQVRHRQRLKELKLDLDRHKSTFAFILTSMTSLQANVTGNTIRGLQSKMNELYMEKELQQREKALKWISSYDYQARYMDLSEKRMEHTGEWLFVTKEYHMWETGTNPIILLEGRPGAGKSVIMSSLVDRLTRREANLNHTAVAYFFNDYREQGSDAVARILASLLHQVVQYLPSLPQSIAIGYETTGRLDRRPTISFLRTQLLDLIPIFKRVYFLIDGFDELPPEAQLELAEIAESFLKAKAWIFISSRQSLASVQLKETGYPEPILIRLDVQQSDDLETYITEGLSEIQQLKNKPFLRENIRTSLVEKADGMFLWVALVLQKLSKSKRTKEMQQALNTTPRELHDVYSGLLLEISRNQEKFELARRMLKWVLVAKSPISADSLASIISQSSNDEGIQRSTTDTIIALCGSFVRIEPSTNHVQLVHMTAREFLLTSGIFEEHPESDIEDNQPSLIRVNKQAAHDHKAFNSTEDIGNIDSDSVSVSSWSSSVFSEVSDTSSQTTALSQMRSVSDQYADMFAHNEKSRPAILACIDRLGVTGFEHEFADALKVYSVDLLGLAKTGSQQIAAIMAGQRTNFIARQTVIMSGYLETHQISTRVIEHAGRPTNDVFVERALNHYDRMSTMTSDGVESSKNDDPSLVTSIGPSFNANHGFDMKLQGSTELGTTGKIPKDIVDADEDCTQIYQNLEYVKVFLTTTEAFEKLINRLQDPVRPLVLAETVCNESNSQNVSGLKLFRAMFNALKVRAWTLLHLTLKTERELEPGMKRVRWTCVCDRQLYDDFLEIVPGAVDELQASLDSIYEKPASPSPLLTMMDSEIPFTHILTEAPIISDGKGSSSHYAELSQLKKSYSSGILPDYTTKLPNQAQQGNDATRPVSLNPEKCAPVERPSGQGDASGSMEMQVPRTMESVRNVAGREGVPSGEDQRQLERDENGVSVSVEAEENKQKSDSESKTNLWILPCFRIARTGHRAKHINVDEQTYDSELFGEFRASYFSERSWLRRFMELKEVSKLDFVQFNLTDVSDASIIKYDVWPPQEVSTAVLPAPDLRQEWHYRPCPVKQIPLVGTDHLLHIWRNPHHADQRAYREWLKSKGYLRHILESLHNWPVRVRQRFFGVPRPRSTGHARTAARKREPDDQVPTSYARSRYIIVKIPKKIGGELRFDLGNDDPIPGWGLRFEESFHIYRLLFALLIFYFIVSITVVVWYLATKGMPSIQEWSEISGLIAWAGSFLALFLTVWFSWAENCESLFSIGCRGNGFGDVARGGEMEGRTIEIWNVAGGSGEGNSERGEGDRGESEWDGGERGEREKERRGRAREEKERGEKKRKLRGRKRGEREKREKKGKEKAKGRGKERREGERGRGKERREKRKPRLKEREEEERGRGREGGEGERGERGREGQYMGLGNGQVTG